MRRKKAVILALLFLVCAAVWIIFSAWLITSTFAKLTLMLFESLFF